MIIAERMMELRAKKEISQETLAKAVGVTQKTIKCWENKDSMPRAIHVIRMARYFGVKIDYLVGLTED